LHEAEVAVAYKMQETGVKRKASPSNGGDDRRAVKKSKGGSGGKWQTPHQKAKTESSGRGGGGKIEPGDSGIWVTCVKGKEGKATQELKVMFDEYAERFYKIAPGIQAEDGEENGEDSIDDIESSIQKEVVSMSNDKNSRGKLFSPVFLNVACVLFFKTQAPIVPVDFVHRICEDAVARPEGRKHRFVNRLTPMTLLGKATENGIDELGKTVLREHFRLAVDETADESAKEARASYAIRPTIRNHKTLKRDAIIKQVASLVASTHKVDLTNPEKVILIEIYQSICGISVVGGDWESLKRFNLAELYQPTNAA